MLAGVGSRPSWSCRPVVAAQLGMGQVERKVKNLTRDGTRRATANTLEWKKWKTNHEEHPPHTTVGILLLDACVYSQAIRPSRL